MRRIIPRYILLSLAASLISCSHDVLQPHHPAPDSATTSTYHARPDAQTYADLRIDATVHKTSTVPFLSHTGAGKYQSYLAQNVPYEPIRALRDTLERVHGVALKHRGEAHITVITPPEFERLASVLSIEEINTMAAPVIQSLRFNLECVGQTTSELNAEKARTFYLVVKSPDIMELRLKIASEYRSRGGKPPAFLTDYHPHITTGFTHRDLHASDGAVKNSASCVHPVTATH